MGKSEVKRCEVRRCLKNRIAESVVDVTLDDCANNPRKIGLRKARINLRNIGRHSSTEQDYCSNDNSDANEDTSTSAPMSHSTGTKKTKLKDKSAVGVMYPPDIWFLIAKYIPPEELYRFSLICKDAYRVILSVHFWKQICKRYQGDETSLPRELRNVSDSRRGLRARAIRLLYLRCPSLMKRIKPPVAPRYEPYTLQGMRLLLAWHEKEGSVWNFYFKWINRNVDARDYRRSELFENTEAGCRVLKATCSEFVCFPYPQYSYLSTIHLGLTSDMRHQKLSLGFSDYTTTHCVAKMKQNLGRGAVVQNKIDLEPISQCILMDWWHPEYPYPRDNVRPSIMPCPDEEW